MSKAAPNEPSNRGYFPDAIGVLGPSELKSPTSVHDAERVASRHRRPDWSSQLPSSGILDLSAGGSADTSDHLLAQLTVTPVQDAPVAEIPISRGSILRDPEFARWIPAVHDSFIYRMTKRMIDVCGALIGLGLSTPLFLLCAWLIKRQDGGPILFFQTRVGIDGRLFKIMKFRSMVVDADQMKSELMDLNQHVDNRTFKILNDPRVTPVGRWMRRLSLDELPQFWNVLRGEMSLVGPRPALPSEVDLYDADDLMRLAVKPGLTCVWQVSGRSNLDFRQQMEMDLNYIRDRGFWTDCMLIAKTLPAIVKGDGAA
jgi:lipopolysaccharide/colanic/teichoic acid biosynthesis glycosyltransferase